MTCYNLWNISCEYHLLQSLEYQLGVSPVTIFGISVGRMTCYNLLNIILEYHLLQSKEYQLGVIRVSLVTI